MILPLVGQTFPICGGGKDGGITIIAHEGFGRRKDRQGIGAAQVDLRTVGIEDIATIVRDLAAVQEAGTGFRCLDGQGGGIVALDGTAGAIPAGATVGAVLMGTEGRFCCLLGGGQETPFPCPYVSRNAIL